MDVQVRSLQERVEREARRLVSSAPAPAEPGRPCALCGAVVPVPSGVEPRISIQATSRRTERVLVVDGREVHRCELGREGSRFYPGS